MDANILFGQALGLGSGWKVLKSEMDVEGRQLRLWLDFERGAQFACPECGQWCSVHDTVEKKWRHLDFWQHRTELIARVPRIDCQKHGVLQTSVPWARPGQRLYPHDGGDGFALVPTDERFGSGPALGRRGHAALESDRPLRNGSP